MSQPHAIQAPFSVLPDPRIDRGRRHKLLDILSHGQHSIPPHLPLKQR